MELVTPINLNLLLTSIAQSSIASPLLIPLGASSTNVTETFHLYIHIHVHQNPQKHTSHQLRTSSSKDLIQALYISFLAQRLRSCGYTEGIPQASSVLHSHLSTTAAVFEPYTCGTVVCKPFIPPYKPTLISTVSGLPTTIRTPTSSTMHPCILECIDRTLPVQ